MSHTSILRLMAVLSLICAACSDQKMQVPVKEVQGLGSSTGGASAGVEIVMAGERGPAQSLHIRMNGEWVASSGTPSELDPVLFPTGETEFVTQPGTYTFELVSADGSVQVRTDPVTVAAGAHVVLVVYGKLGAFRHQVFTVRPLPPGEAHARVMNIRQDHASVDVYTCPSAASAALCRTVKHGLAYGEVWEANLTPGQGFGVGAVAPAGGTETQWLVPCLDPFSPWAPAPLDYSIFVNAANSAFPDPPGICFPVVGPVDAGVARDGGVGGDQ